MKGSFAVDISFLSIGLLSISFLVLINYSKRIKIWYEDRRWICRNSIPKIATKPFLFLIGIISLLYVLFHKIGFLDKRYETLMFIFTLLLIDPSTNHPVLFQKAYSLDYKLSAKNHL